MTTVDAADVLACCGPLDGETLTDRQAAVTAEVFKALGDPHRVQIVNLLASRGRALCVCEFTEPLGVGQPTVSHHLKRLTAVGLLRREQHGRWAYYSLRGEVMDRVASVLASQSAEPAGAGGTADARRGEEASDDGW